MVVSVRVLPAAVLAVLVLAGCTGPQGGPDWLETEVTVRETGADPGERSPDEFWMIRLQGNQTQTFQGSTAVCDRAPRGFTIDRANETVRYDPERYDLTPEDVRVLVAADHAHLTTHCGVSTLEAGPTFSWEVNGMGWGWNVTVTVAGDGNLTLQGTDVPRGSAGVLSFEGDPPSDHVVQVQGNLTVTNLGPWDQDDLRPR